MGALNQYNTDKQRYDESLRRLEEWKKEVDFDSKTTKVKKEEGLANTFKVKVVNPKQPVAVSVTRTNTI